MEVDMTQGVLSSSFDAKQYWERRLGSDPSLREVGYSKLGFYYNRWLYRQRKAVLRRMIATSHIDLPHSRILDIGSGSGFYIELWQDFAAASISGCDLTDASVSYLRSRFPCNEFYKVDIGEALPPDLPRHFDVISAFDVLFHIVDDDRFACAISNIARLLATDGLFCFSDLFLHRTTERGTHFVSRSLWDIERVLARYGLEVVERRPVFVLMNEPIDARNAIWRIAWNIFMYPVTLWDKVGSLWGALLYPLDRCLAALVTESPTTELMVCRKCRPVEQV
jgi:SAM-dependent methyltransferase